MQVTGTLSHRRLITVAGLAWMFDAMDVGILAFIMAALKTDWQLSLTQLGWIGSINSVGMAVGALSFGMLADKIGRKSTFIITLVLFSVASGFSAFAPTLAVFLVLRFLVGMGLGGELPVAATLVSESVPHQIRGRLIVLLESFWALGWILAALIAYLVIPQFGWRVALVLTAIPAFYAIYLRLNMPDSPRFTKHQLSSDGGFKRIKRLWSPPYRQSTMMLWVLWFCVVFSYYGMFLWLPSVMILKGFELVKSFQYVLIMTLAQLPGYFSAAWLIERFGRKFVLVTYLLGTAVSAYFFGASTEINTLVIWGMWLSFFNLGAWGALYAYTPELYPTEIRSTGAGSAAAIGRIGGILGPLFVGLLTQYEISISLIFSVFCVTILMGIMAVLIWGNETKQTELT